MGYYLNPREAQHNHDKTRALVIHHGAKVVACPDNFSEVPEDKALICVVDAGAWQAAALTYNEREFDVFRHPVDQREKDWLLIDKTVAHEMSGYHDE